MEESDNNGTSGSRYIILAAIIIGVVFLFILLVKFGFGIIVFLAFGMSALGAICGKK